MPLKGVRTGRDQSRAIGFESLTVSTVAVGFARSLASLVRGFTFGFIEIQDQPVRVRFEGEPTSAIGHLYLPGQSDVWNPEEVRSAQFIRQAGTDATVVITYYRDTPGPA